MKKFIICIALALLTYAVCSCSESHIPEPDYVTIQGVRLDLNKELAGFGEAEKAHLRKIYVNLGKND